MRERTLWFLLGAGAILCLGAAMKEGQTGAPGSFQMACGSYATHEGSTSCVAMDTRTGKIAWARLVPDEEAADGKAVHVAK